MLIMNIENILNSVKKEKTIDKLVDVFWLANAWMMKDDGPFLDNSSNEKTILGILVHKLSLLLPLFNLNGYFVDLGYESGDQMMIETGNDLQSEICLDSDIVIHSRKKKDLDRLLCLNIKKSCRHHQTKVRNKNTIKHMTDLSYPPDNSNKNTSGFLLGIYCEYNSKAKTMHVELYKGGDMYKMMNIRFDELPNTTIVFNNTDNKFTFHPSGQGLFYSGLIDDGNYSFVYDCGNEHKLVNLVPQINKLKLEIKKHRLDFLAISHFHSDHINFVPELLHILNPKKIVLPYLCNNPELRLLYIAGNVIDENDDINVETPIILNNIYDSDNSIIVKEDKSFVECHWVFKFFNRKITDVDEKSLVFNLKKLLSKYGVSSVRDLLSAKRLSDLKDAYNHLFGSYNYNDTSMVMLHYPEDCNRKYLTLYKGYSHIHKPFSLLTGDIMLDEDLADRIKKSYPDDMPQGFLQIPHHGSYRNWVNFNKYMPIFDCSVPSFGTTNSYGHPCKTIRTDVLPHAYFEVDENQHFIYHIIDV